MSAKIFYFTLQDEQTKEEKLEWFENTPFEQIPFDHITPDKKANWINLTNNDFDNLLPLIDKSVKDGSSQKAVFILFSRGIETTRDEWVYDFNKTTLHQKMSFFVSEYKKSLRESSQSMSIKWSSSLERYFQSKVIVKFHENLIIQNIYRPFIRLFHYSEKSFNHRLTSNHYEMFGGDLQKVNSLINLVDGSRLSLSVLATNQLTNLSLFSLDPVQSIPLYRYDENGNRIDNITDWALTQFQTHYQDPTITKDHIFHYTYAVLHHPAYRTKYEINLKREFPRLPFYANFHQWATWGKTLIDLHLNYETIEPYDLKRVDKSTGKTKPVQTSLLPTEDPNPQKPTRPTTPKAKLKAEKADGKIILDTETTLEGIPALAWDYKLGNRSALEWILDQYKEKTPKDPTIHKLFNTYKFADYKDHVIDLLKRVCTVSLRTMEIIQKMPETVDHQDHKP